MKNIITIFLTTFSLISWGQDFSINIDPGDFSNSKEVTTIYAKKVNKLFIDWDSPFDSCFIEINNGKVLAGGRVSHSIIPDTSGSAIVTAIVKFKNGTTVKKTKYYKVIDYPKLELRVKENSLMTNSSIEFQIFSNNTNVTHEFDIGYFEIEILDLKKESILNTHTVGSLKLNLKKYESQFKIQKGQTIKISSVRLLWGKYNLPAFTLPFEINIE
ncbi:MAG: hypothetical protein AB8B72_14070 [Crocinitomicaceae bacterium]